LLPIAGKMDRPYEWEFHFATLAALLLGVAFVVVAHRHLRRTSQHPILWARHDVEVFAGACAASLVALTWPLADLAAHWSLTALVLQRLILVLAVAPMLILGLPYDVVERITRPAAVDALLSRCQRPATAIGLVTVLIVGPMTPPVVEAQSSSTVLRAALEVTSVVAGLILWIPVLGRVPGIPRLRPMLRFGYLAAQAVVPAFLSFALILSPHPLYPTFAGSHAAIDLRPLNDQQIAGFVSKLTMLIVLLTVGGVGLVKTKTSDEEAHLDDRLVWGDVQRQFERADRRSAHKVRMARTPIPISPKSTTPGSETAPGGPEP
jgi:cytochrome c oxidase assembly factor CtaG